MMRFCAFLRGVNVNGTSMKMADVRDVFESAGLSEVSSVLASGNILFSSEKSVNELKISLERAMSDHFKYDAFMFIKTKDEVKQILQDVPFQNDSSSHVYAFIGEDGIDKMLDDEFSKVKASETEKAKVVNHHFYWQNSKGNTVKSDFGKILGNKRYKHLVTSHNINTIEKILQKL